jgi:hypothetical protein
MHVTSLLTHVYKLPGITPCRMYLTHGKTCFSFVCWCSFEDGLQLVKLRGESMQAAADTKPSAMVSVIGLSSEKVCTSHSNMTQKCLGFYLSVQSFPNSTLQHFTQGSEA